MRTRTPFLSFLADLFFGKKRDIVFNLVNIISQLF